VLRIRITFDVDPDPFHVDPDPFHFDPDRFHFDPDPPSFYSDADPDLDQDPTYLSV
jgi:hypothetical protein